jgi:hypothetical protein
MHTHAANFNPVAGPCWPMDAEQLATVFFLLKKNFLQHTVATYEAPYIAAIYKLHTKKDPSSTYF